MPTLSFAPSLSRPEGLVWFFDEVPAVVTQVTLPSMNVEAASFLAGPLQEMVKERYYAAGRKILYVHDWSACLRYAVDARTKLMEWGRAGAHMTEETIIILSVKASPFVRIALHTGAGMMRGLGMKLTVTEDPSEAVRRFQNLEVARL